MNNGGTYRRGTARILRNPRLWRDGTVRAALLRGYAFDPDDTFDTIWRHAVRPPWAVRSFKPVEQRHLAYLDGTLWFYGSVPPWRVRSLRRNAGEIVAESAIVYEVASYVIPIPLAFIDFGATMSASGRGATFTVAYPAHRSMFSIALGVGGGS